MEKQTVLIVHNHYQIPGGEDTVVENEKKMLEKNGHRVFLYIRDNKELRALTWVQKLSLPITMIFNIKTYCEIKKIIKEKRIDIIHVHNVLNLISPSVYYAALYCKVPIVQTVHNFRFLCPGAIFYRDGHICEDCVNYGLGCALKYKCYRNSRLQTLICVISTKIHRITGIYGKLNYICLTEFNRQKLLQLRQIKPEKVFVKPNFTVDFKKAVSIDKIQDLENYFIYVGRLEKSKGIDILLQAWKMLGKEAPKLIIYGTGTMESWCKKYILENNLISVELKGFVSNDIVREFIAYAKALILPTQWYEGFPMGIVEAFSVGTPVICSDLGNAGCLVTEGINGCKFKADSAQELVQAVKRLKEYGDIRQKVRNIYMKNYTEEESYRIMKKIYNQLV